MKNKLMSAILIFLLLTANLSGCSKASKVTGTSNSGKKEPYQMKKVQNSGGTFCTHDLIYFIMQDRFYDGDLTNNVDTDKSNPGTFHGGDIKGIIKKLDYIKSLGTTAIWLTPVFLNAPSGYHGYWIYDFYKIDPHFGTMDDLKTMVSEAHKRNMKVIIDYVVNHTGQNSPWLTDGKHNGWFHPKMDIANYDDQKQCENGWLAGLPDLDQSNPDVKKYFMDNSIWFIKNTGIDGMRLDTVKHVPKEFWNEFSYNIKSKYPEFYLLGEAWSGSIPFIEDYHKVGIDGMIDYPLYFGIKDAFSEFGSTDKLIKTINEHSMYSNPEINGIFIDNHDNKRFITGAGDNGLKRLELALTFIMTYPSIPVVYYGTEIGMEGGNDPDNRRDMEWDKVNSSKVIDFYRNLTNIRNSNPALYSSEFKLNNYNSYFISYARGKGNNTIYVAMNIYDDKANEVIDVSTNGTYIDLISKKEYKAVDNKIKLYLNPLQPVILKVK